MRSATELLNNEIYPALFHVLPEALPEFEFTRRSDRYRSTNTLKVSGELGQSIGKVEVLERAPFWLKDYREGGRSIWDYVQQRDGLTTNGEVIKRLGELAQINLPDQQLSPEESDRIQKANFESKLWEVINDFFIDCLSNPKNQYAHTPMAKATLRYLESPVVQGGRGYTASVVRLPGQTKDANREAPKMELGFIPGIWELGEYLTKVAEYSESDISSIIKKLSMAGHSIGEKNVLTFPYRDHAGRIRGMVFRSLTGGEYKYLYSHGLERNQILFNLRAVAKDADLSIVESPLDALHAAALGIKNVTALGGSGDSLNTTQVDLAIRYGAKRITLLLDNDSEGVNDRAGALGTDRAVSFLQKNYPGIRVFVGEYPSGVKDLDELFNREGIEGYQRVKDNAIESWRYQLNRLFIKYSRLNSGDGDLTPKQVANLQDEVIESAVNLLPIDYDQYIKCFVNTERIKEIGITEQSVADAVNEKRAQKAKDARKKAVQDLLSEANSKLVGGDEQSAIDLLQTKAREIRQNDKAGQFDFLLQPVSEKDLSARLQQRPNDIRTGYIIEGNDLELPAGAISIIAAPTSHGKTTFLINTALRISHYHPDKTVYLLSYEEDGDAVLISAMNTYIGKAMGISDPLGGNGRKSIKSYYKSGGNNEYIKRDGREHFDTLRERFFNELIKTRRLVIQYVDYSLESLIEAIYHIHKYGNAGAILIDYIQLINKESGKFASRQVELKSICMDLKDAAVETGLPLVLGAQFSREVVNAARMHPTKIGEAGDIERAANLILGFWNNNMKPLAKEEELDALNKLDPRKDALYVELLKYRGGKPGLAGMLSFDGNTGVISNIDSGSTSFTASKPKDI